MVDFPQPMPAFRPPDSILQAQRTVLLCRPQSISSGRYGGSAAMLRRLRRRSCLASGKVGENIGVSGRHVTGWENMRCLVPERLVGKLMSCLMATPSEKSEFLSLLHADRAARSTKARRNLSAAMTALRRRSSRRTTLEHRRELARLRVARFRARRRREESRRASCQGSSPSTC